MARYARKTSQTGIYHIMVRGINGHNIFHDEDDYKRYLETLSRISDEGEAQVLGYCLMSNHVHLLISEGKDSISLIMKRLGGSYAYWYNWKYERKGYVFQDRFKSENVEDDAYLQTVIRYIHRNPVKAGIVEKPEAYLWSSSSVYLGGKDFPPGLTKTGLILGLFHNGKQNPQEIFGAFMEENDDIQCLDYVERKRITDREAEKIFTGIMKEQSILMLKGMPKKERDDVLRRLKNIEGVTIRQVSRLTGIGQTAVQNA
jgi:Transposase and inactivated derivatives